jgi:dTDP-glucose 4,6-dehydratase
MRILVTGAEGTLGRPLCEALEARGDEVLRVDQFHSHHPSSMRVDVSKYGQLEGAFALLEPDVVYHLAAEFGRINGELWYEQLWMTNAIGTRNVLELCAKFHCGLIFASSSEVYGDIPADLLSEDMVDTFPIKLPNEYALSKRVNEIQIQNFFSRRTEMPPPIVCRFFNSYGPGEEYHDYRSVVALFCYRALTGQPFKVYEGYSRTFMFIDDFIPTLATASISGKGGQIYNIGGVDYRSVEELAEIVIEQSGADPGLIERVGQDEHNVVSKKPDITKAQTDLAHCPVIALEEGVPATIDWMRARYRIAA